MPKGQELKGPPFTPDRFLLLKRSDYNSLFFFSKHEPISHNQKQLNLGIIYQQNRHRPPKGTNLFVNLTKYENMLNTDQNNPKIMGTIHYLETHESRRKLNESNNE